MPSDVTILPKPPEATSREAAVLAEKSLAVDWNRPEKDLAWAHLQSVK